MITCNYKEMRVFNCFVMLLFMSFSAWAQTAANIDSSYNNWYYQQRMDLYEKLEGEKHDIVFLGNSIIERGGWDELIPRKMVANRGIGGDNTFGVLARLDNVIDLSPKKLFILIGINDLGRGLPIGVVADNYEKIIRKLKGELPKTLIYVQSVLPLNETILKYDYLKGKAQDIATLNHEIQQLAEIEKLTYINLHELFADEDGQLKESWTSDGIHLLPVAYSYWVAFLKQKKYL